jgi:phosphohistidine swiveling domain-containing protein
MADDEVWPAPGLGRWMFSPEHMPRPACTLLVELLPAAGLGWRMGTDRYGLPPNLATFGASNRWFFFSPGGPVALTADEVDELDRRAVATLAERRWRDELERWRAEVRPAAVARHRALLAVDLPSLDDADLAAQVQAAIDLWNRDAPLHFDGTLAGAVAAGVLLEATDRWGVDRRAVIEALAGEAASTSSVARRLQAIAADLRAAGVEDPTDLDAVRSAGPAAAAALEEVLVEEGWRAFHCDLLEPTLAERPEALLVAIRAAVVDRPRPARPSPDLVDRLLAQVPEEGRAEVVERLADARGTYGHNDDNSVVLFATPLGLVRRAVLEVGRRLAARERLGAVDDAFEATSGELAALLSGAGPAADELAGRSAERRRVAALSPPRVVSGPPHPDVPPVAYGSGTQRLVEVLGRFQAVAWSGGGPEGRAAVTVGTEVVRGRAVVVVDPTEALLRMEPGDVLVAGATTAAFNALFPVAAAVAVEHGSLMSHPAVLARELGVPAVIGLPGLLEQVADGDLVEVDPGAGTVRVVDPAARGG